MSEPTQPNEDACGRSDSTEVLAGWLPIETAPKDGRTKILLKVPYNLAGVLAWSNTWWTSGFSVENKPSHWKPANGQK